MSTHLMSSCCKSCTNYSSQSEKVLRPHEGPTLSAARKYTENFDFLTHFQMVCSTSGSPHNKVGANVATTVELTKLAGFGFSNFDSLSSSF